VGGEKELNGYRGNPAEAPFFFSLSLQKANLLSTYRRGLRFGATLEVLSRGKNSILFRSFSLSQDERVARRLTQKKEELSLTLVGHSAGKHHALAQLRRQPLARSQEPGLPGHAAEEVHVAAVARRAPPIREAPVGPSMPPQALEAASWETDKKKRLFDRYRGRCSCSSSPPRLAPNEKCVEA